MIVNNQTQNPNGEAHRDTCCKTLFLKTNEKGLGYWKHYEINKGENILSEINYKYLNKCRKRYIPCG